MGGFVQFRLNIFKQSQTHFSQLHTSLDSDELESCNFMCSSITAMLKGLSEEIFMRYLGRDGSVFIR